MELFLNSQIKHLNSMLTTSVKVFSMTLHRIIFEYIGIFEIDFYNVENGISNNIDPIKVKLSIPHISHFQTEGICGFTTCTTDQTCCPQSTCFPVKNGVCCTKANGTPYACKYGQSCASSGYCYTDSAVTNPTVAIVSTVVLISLCCIGVILVLICLRCRRINTAPPMNDPRFVNSNNATGRNNTPSVPLVQGYATAEPVEGHLPTASAYVSRSIEASPYVHAPLVSASISTSRSVQKSVNSSSL